MPQRHDNAGLCRLHPGHHLFAQETPLRDCLTTGLLLTVLLLIDHGEAAAHQQKYQPSITLGHRIALGAN